MKTSARFQLPVRPFLLILFCVHAALYVLQFGDYCHRGKNRDQIADCLGSQISTTTTSPPLPPSCVLFLVPRRRSVFFSRLYIAEVTPIHLKETSIIQAGETGRVLYTLLDNSLLICCCAVIHGRRKYNRSSGTATAAASIVASIYTSN
jgi:hypothetical protein